MVYAYEKKKNINDFFFRLVKKTLSDLSVALRPRYCVFSVSIPESAF